MFTQSAFAKKEYEIGVFLLVSIIVIAITYLTTFSIPLKFFLPGILFLTAFVIGPILYTVVMSTYQYQTGNYISKDQSIERVQMLGIAPDEANTTFDVVVGKYNNQIAVLASDSINQRYLLSTPTEKIELSPSLVTVDENGVATKVNDFTPATGDEIVQLDFEISSTRFKYEGDYFIMLEGSSVGAVARQVLDYDESADKFINLVDGSKYQDNGLSLIHI